MILECISIRLMQLVVLASVVFVSETRSSVLSWMSSSVCILIVFPSATQQWSFLGLNLWPSQTVEEPSNGFDLSGNPISRGRGCLSDWIPILARVTSKGDRLQFTVDLQVPRELSGDVWENPRPSSVTVLNFFPTPVQEECLSRDKRRQGVCMNTYECRIQRGKSHGRCALGFGVCCIFTASCEQEVQNNLTYVISPGFPNLIDWPMNCSVVVRKIDRQVSQLRIDFVHFNIGQPNSRTGVCDDDIMEIRNGRSVFQMCGWNSGQHLYIDLDESDDPLTLDFRLPSGLQSRMWEMRIVQLDFEQRAPTGCLQYFQGFNGTLKTLNFLSNGRFLADQDYLLCIRQERGMCGISYTPCSPDSFRIGPSRMLILNNTNFNSSMIAETSDTNSTAQNMVNVDSTNNTETDIEGSGSDSMEEVGTLINTTNPMEQEVSSSTNVAYGRERCRDRVLIPCDFEEFITPGNNQAGICNLEHCGNSLCERNELDEEGNCRVETWATPFRIRVAFGPGQDTGTTLEDNIGMCLVYEQLPCIA